MTEQTGSTSTEDPQESPSASEESTESGSAESESSESDSSESGSAESGSSEETGSTEQKPSEPARRSPDHQKPEPPGESDREAQRRQQESLTHSDAASEPPRGRESRKPVNVGELVWRVATILASAVRIVGFVLAAILVVYVVLTIVGVNPANGVAQVVAGIATTVVLAFRDLFVPADPVLAIILNFGLAAAFWMVVAEFGSRLIRFVGARLS